ncbi:4-aminobutyrate--2-oxoglutarate transaminase [Sphingopyxis sp. JAI128]|uniref:4-aminobutyrate--2-oxoglutarate transaminase n=1 Tax=Sphingopyxis sp. JAI128 TaxID=2723066 RepID=UPI0016100A53|nr:4-aminobutyrate--2-oxoglutarate transaminase [Sphingopyxis sp. JAI128]MBB6427154.1 4-aminobutyrate aminotransferase/(S)-3-amino-2-methylpropionate transaminase [Sphingopyxis sp. JAI128]
MARNIELLNRRSLAVPRGVATALPIFVERAENAEMWDEDGRRYIDFAGGIAVLNVGHRHPRVAAAVRAQLDDYMHVAFQVTAYAPYVELAERLNALAPFSGEARTLLLTTGAEAVENAVKIARAATGRAGVIAFTGGFHGRTALTMALTGKVTPYKRGFGASVPNVYHLPFPVPHHGIDVDQTLRALQFLFAADLPPEDVAAIIIEPVQGEGGFHAAPAELLAALRKLCDEYGIMLIADEVQTGFGRTGRMFGIEHSGVEPDLVTVAKSMGGGLPISGVIGRAAVMDAVEPGGLGGTYGGSPLGCAAGLAVLDVIEDEGLLERAVAMGKRIVRRLKELAARNDLLPIGHIRGLGAMIAFDMLEGQGSDTVAPNGAKTVTTRAADEGLILLGCGTYGETIRILVPLTASDAIVDEGLAAIERALRT